MTIPIERVRAAPRWRTPGPQPNGLQATPDGLWAIDRDDLHAYLLAWGDGRTLARFPTDTHHASGITWDGEAIWVASTFAPIALFRYATDGCRGWLAYPRTVHRPLRRAVVRVVQPAEHGDGLNLPVCLRSHHWPLGAVGEVLLHALVRPRAVAVRRVLAEDTPEGRLAADEDVVQARAAHAAAEALAGGVLPGRAVGGPQHGDPARLGHARERRSVLAIVVADAVRRSLAEGRRLAQLACR